MGVQTDTFHYIDYSPKRNVCQLCKAEMAFLVPHLFQYVDGTCPKFRQRTEGAWKLRFGNVLSKPHLRQRLDCI